MSELAGYPAGKAIVVVVPVRPPKPNGRSLRKVLLV